METIKIVKIGGHIIDDKNELTVFLKQFSQLEGPKILVHGGGKLATRMAEQMGVEVQMTNGRRITNKDTLEIITMVYAGKINKAIVSQLQGLTCNAIGLTGADANSIRSVKRPVKAVDFGYVGDVVQVDNVFLELLLKQSITPVFCAITHDNQGQLLNTNADTIASELAIALSKTYATQLYYCFEKSGVLHSIEDDKSVIPTINSNTYNQLKADGIIADGMLPKLNNCFHALNQGVQKIGIGKTEMIFNENSTYTTIIK